MIESTETTLYSLSIILKHSYLRICIDGVYDYGSTDGSDKLFWYVKDGTKQFISADEVLFFGHTDSYDINNIIDACRIKQ